MFRLDHKAAVVIGAGSGIGRASAAGLAAQGAHVVCADLDLASAHETARLIGDQKGVAESRLVDVTNADQVRQVFRDTAARWGGLHVVVSTPAINVRKAILDYSAEELDLVVSLNIKGTFHVLKEAGTIMSAAGTGSIIVFSSIRAQVVEPGQGIYAATKAGIVQMVRALAAELGPSGVRVNTIAPGVVETPLTQPIKANPEWYEAYAAKSVFRRWARPEEMAGPVVFLASDASSYVTGTVLYVDGGWTAADGRFTPPL